MTTVTFEAVYANAYIRKSVSVTIARQARQYPVLAAHTEDMEQQLWLCIAKAVEDFDNDAAKVETFVRAVIERRINNIRRCYFTESARRQYSSIPLDQDDELPIYAQNDIHLVNLRMDLADTLKNLDEQSRQVCHWIMDGHTFSAIAKRLGVSESTFYFLYVHPIRREFQKENLQNYLANY